MSKYIPELDGLRAIAVLLVITGHMNTDFWRFAFGGLGVFIFFVLSGYLITSLALREEKETGALSFTGFYIRRTFRIFPLYYLVLAAYCVLILGLGIQPYRGPLMSANMPFYLTYLQEVPFFQGRLLTFGHSWSLGIEEKFYLLWPLVAFLLLRHKRSWRLVGACLLAVAATLSPDFIAPYASILIGCALALALRKAWAQNAIKSAGATGAYVSFAALILVHALLIPHWDDKFGHLFYSVLVAISLAFILLVPTRVNQLLGWAPLAFVGKVSYGVYLVHHLCVNAGEAVMRHRTIPSWLVTIVLSIGIAYFLHITVEKPLIQIGRNLASKYSEGETRGRMAVATR
jgi:peptidoglycan/LPS O-acetylase OafA/YrhL